MNYSTDRILNPNKHDRSHRYCQLPNLWKKALANQTWLSYRLLSTVFFLLYIILLITQSPLFTSCPSFHHITSFSLPYWFSPFFSLNSFILYFCSKTSDQLTSPSSSSFCPSFHTLTSVQRSSLTAVHHSDFLQLFIISPSLSILLYMNQLSSPCSVLIPPLSHYSFSTISSSLSTVDSCLL